MTMNAAESTLTIRVKVPAGFSEEQKIMATCAAEQMGEAINSRLESVADGESDGLVLEWLTGQSLVDGKKNDVSVCADASHLEDEKDAFAQELMGEAPDPSEQKRVRLALLNRSFAARRELFKETITVNQVAEMLDLSRQAVHQRVRKDLFAATEKRLLHFPLWQFDPQAENGVLTGIPEVISALTEAKVPVVAQLSWMVRANPFLDDKTPADCLQQGEVKRVVDAAHAIGLR